MLLAYSVCIVFCMAHHLTHRADEEKGIATGSKSGQICIWDLYRKRGSEDVVVSRKMYSMLSRNLCVLPEYLLLLSSVGM